SPAISAPSSSRRSAGRWPRRSRTIRGSQPVGSATARRPRAIFTQPLCSPRPTAPRSCSTSSTTSGQSRPSRALRGEARAPLPRALGFGLPALRVDANDYLALHSVAKWAIERARCNLGPTLIEYVTYRVGAHSTSDDPSAYRPKTESDAWPLGDPVIRLKNHLILRGAWTEERHRELEEQVLAEVIAAQREAERHGTLHAGGRPSTRDMFEGVYETMPPHLRRQRQQAGV